MIFKGTPNLLVRITRPRRGEVKLFTFDENGIYETNHPFTAQRLRATYEEVKEETSIGLTKVENNVIPGEEIKLEDMSEEQVRELAKGKKIKSWHNKKIENLILELKGES